MSKFNIPNTNTPADVASLRAAMLKSANGEFEYASDYYDMGSAEDNEFFFKTIVPAWALDANIGYIEAKSTENTGSFDYITDTPEGQILIKDRLGKLAEYFMTDDDISGSTISFTEEMSFISPPGRSDMTSVGRTRVKWVFNMRWGKNRLAYGVLLDSWRIMAGLEPIGKLGELKERLSGYAVSWRYPSHDESPHMADSIDDECLRWLADPTRPQFGSKFPNVSGVYLVKAASEAKAVLATRKFRADRDIRIIGVHRVQSIDS